MPGGVGGEGPQGLSLARGRRKASGERSKMQKRETTDSYAFDTSALLTIWNEEEGGDSEEQRTQNLSKLERW